MMNNIAVIELLVVVSFGCIVLKKSLSCTRWQHLLQNKVEALCHTY